MNQRLKHAAELAALASGVPAICRRLKRRRSLVLAYHNVVPAGVRPRGDLSLHLTQKAFSEQLDCLLTLCEVVPLTSLIDGTPARARRPRVAITFDDAYLGAVTAGMDELTRRDMPFTIFVAPGLLGQEPWWDTAAEAMDGAIPHNVRSEWLQRLAGDGSAILREVPAGHFRDVANQPSVGSKISSPELLKEMTTRRGASVASHAWTHRNLAALAEEGVRAELVRSIEWLSARFSCFVPLLAYPYGLSSRMVEVVAAEVGYRAAFLVDGGWLPERPAMSPFTLPRMNVPAGLSLNGFRLRLSGIGTP